MLYILSENGFELFDVARGEVHFVEIAGSPRDLELAARMTESSGRPPAVN